MPTPSGPYVRSAATLLSLAVAGSLTLTLAPAATSATAATPAVSAFTITGKALQVKTSTGKRLTVTVAGIRNTAGAGRVAASSALQQISRLSVTLSKGAEAHVWNFGMPNTALRLAQTGKGRIAPGATRTAPWAKVALTATPKGSVRTTVCQGQTVMKTKRVTLTGTFWFNTRSGSHGWGTLGNKSAKKKFTFATSAIATWYFSTSAQGCAPAPTTRCRTDLTWDIFNNTMGLSGDNSRLDAWRGVNLAKPRGATRQDLVTATVSPEFTQDAGAGTAALTIKGRGGSVTGSARINASDVNVDSSQTCGSAGQHLRSTIWNTTTYTNDSSPLAVHDIYGAITAPNGTFSDLSLTTPVTAN